MARAFLLAILLLIRLVPASPAMALDAGATQPLTQQTAQQAIALAASTDAASHTCCIQCGPNGCGCCVNESPKLPADKPDLPPPAGVEPPAIPKPFVVAILPAPQHASASSFAEHRRHERSSRHTLSLVCRWTT